MGGLTPWQGWPYCPCGSGVEALKLSAVLKRGPHEGERHVVGCKCRSHISKRSRKSGQHAQATMHRDLGGTGFTPTHEESGRGYPIQVVVTEGGTEQVEDEVRELKVHPESKQGGQVPASLTKFLGTEWYRRSLQQSTKSLPVGSGAKPAVWCQMPGGRKVLVVDYGGGR